MVKTPFDIPASKLKVGDLILDIPDSPEVGQVLTFGEDSTLEWGVGSGSEVIAEEELSSAQTTITLTGLDGDEDGYYEIDCFFNLLNGTINITMRPNGETSNLSCELHNNGSVSDTSDWRLLTSSGVSGEHVYYLTIKMHVSRSIGGVNNYRAYHLNGARLFQVGSFGISTHTGGGIYTDTSANLTTLEIVSSLSSAFLAGTKVIVRKL
jgi:hypothetical protein